MKKMNNKFLRVLNLSSKICTEIFTVFFGVLIVGGTILFENMDAVNTVLKSETQRVEQDPVAANKDSEYFKTSFKNVKEVRENGKVYAETIVSEGSTLLKNENNTLPLAKDSMVSLFSTSSVDPILTGTGSGSNSGVAVTLKEGFCG